MVEAPPGKVRLERPGPGEKRRVVLNTLTLVRSFLDRFYEGSICVLPPSQPRRGSQIRFSRHNFDRLVAVRRRTKRMERDAIPALSPLLMSFVVKTRQPSRYY